MRSEVSVGKFTLKCHVLHTTSEHAAGKHRADGFDLLLADIRLRQPDTEYTISQLAPPLLYFARNGIIARMSCHANADQDNSDSADENGQVEPETLVCDVI